MATIDHILLEQAHRGEGQALAKIYDRYATGIYRYLCRLVGDPWTAEDLTSDVFVKLLGVLNSRRAPRKNLQAWLYRVAHNLAMDWFRTHARMSDSEVREDIPVEGASPLAELEQAGRHVQLQRALCQLTASQQQVILLRFGEGLSIQEVSRIVGKSEGAVKLLQHRGVKRLRTLLEREERRIDVQETSRSVRSITAASSAGRDS